MPAATPDLPSPSATDVLVPEVSVIIPVYRQWRHLSALVQALHAQDIAGDRFEIILVNNDVGSALGQNVLAALPATGIRHVECAAPGSYAARNVGTAMARAPLLAFTDADCLPAPDWLRQLLLHAKAHPDHLIAGRIDITLPPDLNRWAVFDHVRGIPQHLFVAHGYGATANLAVPRAVHQRLDGFDASRKSGGDAEFCRRAGRLGIPMLYADSAIVRHPARTTLAALAVKARRVKGGQVASGPWQRRLFWTLRSLVPPFREIWIYARTPAPWPHRLTAMQVRLRLWGVELVELARLLIWRADPERR